MDATPTINQAQNKYSNFLITVAHLPSFPIFLGYLSIVFLSGIYTRISRPLSLKWILVAYNSICVALSVAATLLLCYGVYDQGTMFAMQHNAHVKQGMYVYYMSKYVELFDTIFMILRHRHRQVSFLQVYHHSSVLVLGNYAYAFTPWAPIAVLLGLNSLVHVFLYTYYAMAALSMTSSQKWKRHLTQLQMAQFVFAMVHCLWGYLYHKFCVYGTFYGFSMFLLFSQFYYAAYIKVKTPKPRAKAE